MEGIIALILLIIVGSIVLLIWLALKTVNLLATTSELRRRQDQMEAELRQLVLSSIGTVPAERQAADRARGAQAAAAALQPKPLRTEPPVPVATPPPLVQKPAVTPAPSTQPPPLAVRPSAVPVAPAPASKKTLPAINWEQFMGVKLFAWIGGLALFLGVAFFVKYSFDNNLISPEMRIALSFLTGIGLVIGGFILKQKDYAVTAQTLCATGIVILYAATFACHSIYHFAFFGLIPTFVVMALITTTAFLLAVRMEAQVVAVLGIVGGFLTPVLLGSNVDNPLGLFGYIALLDMGLIAVAMNRRWDYLVLFGAIGTIATQIGWVGKFFEAAKVYIAMAIFLGFDVLFLLAFGLAGRRKQSSAWLAASILAASFVSLGFVFYLLTIPGISERPPVIFSFVLGADLCLLALVLLDPKLHPTHLASGGVVFLLLSVWTIGYLTNPLLNWALGFYLLFAILHSVYPLTLQRLRPGTTPVWWAHIFPPLALLLVMLPLFRFTELTWLLWPCVLLIDVLAIGLAVLTASLTAIIAVLLLTVAATATWVLRVPVVTGDLMGFIVVIGGFAVFFFIVGVFAGKKVFGTVGEALGGQARSELLLELMGLRASPELLRAQIPALSAILPFLLLIMVVMKLPLADPSPVFGLALLMLVLLLGVARAFKLDALAAVALACILALEYVWHQQRFHPDAATIPLVWYLSFYATFAVFPFLFRKAFKGRILAWAVAALSGPAHFYLVHTLMKAAYPSSHMGLVPAAFAVPALLSLAALVRKPPAEDRARLAVLAWFGGSALFFITLIFPIQFDRQWITIGWALEGAALLWLFRRVPHPGLPLVGVALLVTAFVRLALNPAVLTYHTRTITPIWNWYLYAYGIVSLCLFAGAWLMRAPRNLVLKTNVPPILVSLGAVLAFLLVNIEIADYFTPRGATALVFEFSGDFGRDMTYTIAWALYAFVLLILGIWKQVRPARYAGLGLLSLTLLKLFFHDLAQLAQLYRIGALVAVAVIAILASFLYQRFFAQTKTEKPNETTA
jgi:uncharacterized membrane protein